MPSTSNHSPSAARIARIVLTLVWVLMASGVFSGATTVLADTVSVGSSGTWSNARTTGGSTATCAWYGVPNDGSGDDDQVRYGVPVDYSSCPSKNNGYRKQSGFGFQGSDVPAVTPGQPFLLGRFRHYNNPIWSPSNPLQRVNLRIALTIATSGGSQSPNLDYVVGLHETPNSRPCQYFGSTVCPDRSWFVNTIPTQTFWIGGVEYTLEILGFQSSSTYDPSAPPINEFITEENQTNTAYLFGRITALEPAIVVDKTADPTSGMAGDPITYSYAVGNAGNVALSDVSVSDDRCDPVMPVLAPTYNAGDTNHDNKLDTRETWQFTCNYTVAAGHAVDGEIVNTATAQGVYQTTTVTDTDTATVTLLTDDDCDDYDISLASSNYDAGSNTTTFTYTVSVKADAVHAISHWVLGLGPCITANDIAAASDSYDFGTDPTTGLSGIKFDVSVEKGQSETFWIRLNGEWPVGMTDTALKAGQLRCYDEVEGPVCLPSIDVEKRVSVDGGSNWHDADSPTGPETPVGSPVSFQFVVTNDGKFPLSDVSLIDDSDLGLAGCTIPTSLAVGASFTCTVDATAIAGQHENTATAEGSYSEQTVSDTDKAHYYGQAGNLDVAKVVDWNGVAEDPTQTFQICIQGPSYADGDCQTVSATGGWTASWDNLIPGDYTVTETDPGSEWTVSGSGVTVTVPTDGSSASTTITNTRVQRPDLDLTKVANPTASDPEGVVTYTLYYTNSGNITLTNVSLADDPDETYVASIGAISDGGVYDGDEITWSIGSLAAGATGSVTYQATMKDDAAFDPGQTEVDNIATIDSDQTDPVDADATVTVTLLSAPSLSLTKEIATSASGPWQESVTVLTGADVYYRFTVTNTGNIRLTNVTIDDDTLSTPGCGWPTLARGASATCVVGPATALAGEQVNTATATGLLPDETEIASDEDTASYIGLTPAIDVVKTADPTVAYPGDTVTYNYVVTNTGAVTLTGIVLNDDVLGPITLSAITLGPNESASGTMTYTVQAGDTSPIVNTATVTGTATVGNETKDVTDQDDATVNIVLPASLTIVKDAAGDTAAEFDFTLDEQQLAFSVLPRDAALPVSFTLKGGESETFALEPGRWYNVTETSMPDGWVLVDIDCNWAQPVGISQTADPNSVGGWLGEGQNVTCTFYNRLPGLQIAKSVEPANAEPGETVVYTIAYSNTGSLDLTGVSITDDPDETYVASVGAISNGGVYAAGKITWTIGDLAAGAGGSVTYQATLKGEDAFEINVPTAIENVAVIDSDQTGPAQDEATVMVTRLLQPVPGLAIDKVGSVTTAHIGDTVVYTITVQNTGNITLTNVTVVDAKLGIDEDLGDLAPGASQQVTGSYLVTEADLDGVVNTAVADSDQTDKVEDTWTVTVVSGPALSIEKVGSVEMAHIGDTVLYTITVRNVGDVTLTNVTIVDAKLKISETIASLAPGASAQVTGSYLVTEADLDGVVNTAVADSDQTDKVEDTWTVRVVGGPALSIEKVGSVETAHIGDTVNYVITVSNLGDVTLTNVSVVDAKLGINQTIVSLAPGASQQVTGSYLVTEADLGGVVNTAVADSDQTDKVEDTWTVDVASQPGLVIVKTVNTATAEVGDLISYTLTVTNTGDVPLTDVTISDPMLGIVHNIGGLAVGESARMEAPYTVTEDDLEGIYNVATVTGQDPEGRTLTDDDEATVVVERQYEQPATPVPCIRSDVAVVVFGGWNDIPVKAWVGGTEQETLYTALDAFGQQQVMWTFYPPENTSWDVTVQPQTPEGKDPARWQYQLVRIESPSLGTENNSPSSASVSIRRCNQYVLYFQLMDNGVTPDVAPTPPAEPRLPVTGGGPEPIVAGGLGLFAALSGLGWSIRRRR